MVDGGCRRAVVPTYPAVCQCRLVRVCPSGLTQSPFRTPKGLVSVRVSRDPVEILPQTILLSPRGVSGISHPGRNESFAKQSSVRRMETTAFLQVHGSHPVSNEFGRGTGPGAHVAAIPHAKGVRGCAPRSISVLRSSIDGSSAERLVLGLAQCGPTFISNRTPKATPAVRGR